MGAGLVGTPLEDSTQPGGSMHSMQAGVLRKLCIVITIIMTSLHLSQPDTADQTPDIHLCKGLLTCILPEYLCSPWPSIPCITADLLYLSSICRLACWLDDHY